MIQREDEEIVLLMVERVAHRGGSALAPENTLAAFHNALTLTGADGKERIVDAIECDVQMSCDGHIVVFHDYTAERLTDGKGNMLDLDFAYLRGLNAATHFSGGWPEPQQIPTLSEVLELARGRARIYIEIKFSKRDGVYGHYPNIAEAVVNDLRATNMVEQALIISFDWAVLSYIRSLEPALQTGAIVGDEAWNTQEAGALAPLVEQVQSLGCGWLNLDQKLCSEAVPQVVHEHGMKLGLWTVNTLEDMRRFTSMGVDSITSDRPDLFALL